MKRIVFVSCLVGSFSIFYPILFISFLSEDFSALYRVCFLKIFWTYGFFRPVGNYTLLLTYWIFGLNPVPFHAFNIFFHALNAFLVFMLCQKLIEINPAPLQLSSMRFFPLFGALLFLFYPFLSENIVWPISRYS